MTKNLALALLLAFGATPTTPSTTGILASAARPVDDVPTVNLEDPERGTIVGWRRGPGERHAAQASPNEPWRTTVEPPRST
jgi:hypothetical protein